jgi:anti-sigma factor RsiW
MNCRGVLDALSDYLEGDAGSSVCEKIEEHLRGCKRCRMHVDAMKRMITLYKKWRGDPIPEDVQMRLKNVVAKECALSGIDTAAGPGSGGPLGGASRGKTRRGTRPKR